MASRTYALTPQLHQYLIDVGTRYHPVLKKLHEKTVTMPGGKMLASEEQAHFMGFLVELIQAKMILEIGTFTGFSALAMALYMPPDGKLITCDIDPNSTNIAKAFWQEAGVESNIELRLAPAIETMATLPENAFDLIFIDANKRAYMAYYERSLALLKTGGLMLIDNVLWEGEVADPTKDNKRLAAIREINQFIHQDERVTCSMIPISEGLTLVRKR